MNNQSIYESNIDLLIKEKVIPSDEEVYFPTYNGEYYKLFAFFQDYLERTSFNFPKPIFFFGSEESLNAWAWEVNGLSVVCINIYSIESINSFIDDNKIFVTKYLTIRGINIQYDNGLHACTIMKQMVKMFLFYHEFGHLIQEQDPVLSSVYIDEQSVKDDFDILDHVAEYDSDLFATVRIVTHLLKIYERQAGLNSNESKQQFLEDICIIAITSYVMYRLKMFPDYGEFYTKESTHPHIILRITILTTHLTKATIDNSNVEISKNRILEESISFIENFAELLPNNDAAVSFNQMGKKNFDQIAEYMHELNQLSSRLEGTAHRKSQNMIK